MSLLRCKSDVAINASFWTPLAMPNNPLPHAPGSISGCRVVAAQVTFVNQPLVQPFVLSTGSITVLTEARATVVVRTPQGTEVAGFGSIYLSDLWAWPDPALSHEHRDKVLRQLSEWIAHRLPDLVGSEAAHPLELGLRLHHHVCETTTDPAFDGVPSLALAMCLSPFDAAIHDAVGKATETCAMRFYEGQPIETSADAWFETGGAFEAIHRTLAATPEDRFDAWYLVGKNDDLEKTVRPWYDQQGYHCFKLKLHGQEIDVDVARTAQMHQAAVAWGCQPKLSVDTNEACESADFVLGYLQKLQRDHPDAFASLAYLEQPTARDIKAHPYDWREVTQLKPVLLDEGLTSLDRLPLALEQGWSGLALKTCKGHSFALVAAAWAHAHGLTVALQDLTNPGHSAVHAALFAAYVPTINGLELNSPQFTPQANQGFLQDWPGLFEVREGSHRLTHTEPAGLGATPERSPQGELS